MSERSTAGQHIPVRGRRWIDWLFIWNGKKDNGKGQGDNNNNGSTVDASIADESAKKFIEPEIPVMDNSTLETTHTDIMKVVDDNSIINKALAFMRESNCTMEQRMKLFQDFNTTTVEILQEKYDWVIEKLNYDTNKMIKTSNNRFNHYEWKKEDKMFVKEKSTMLIDKYNEVEKKIKAMDNMVSAQNLMLNKAIENIQIYTEQYSTSLETSNFESTAVYEAINNQIEKLVNTVDSLKFEKQSLIQTIQNMSKEINVYKRKYTMNKKYINKLKTQMKKDLAYFKLQLYSQITVTKSTNNEKTRNISLHKYKKFKMRLSNTERAEKKNQNLINQMQAEQMRQNMMIISGAYFRCGENEVNNVQQAYSLHPAIIPLPLKNCTPPSPKIPHPPSFQLQVDQHYKFTINSDILKEMSSKLRKPDGSNVRKIPKRKDINIHFKVTNIDEQDVSLLSSPAPNLPVFAPESLVVDLESSIVPLPELPLTLVDTKFPVVLPKPSPPSITVYPELTVETLALI